MKLGKRIFHFSKNEVSQLLKRAKRTQRTTVFDVLASPRKHDYARLLVITPRRTAKASQRNKIRRRLKALFYEEEFYTRAYDYIFIIKKPAFDLSFDQLKTLFAEGIEAQ